MCAFCFVMYMWATTYLQNLKYAIGVEIYRLKKKHIRFRYYAILSCHLSVSVIIVQMFLASRLQLWLRSATPDCSLKIWVLAASSFSPYTAEFWECNVQVSGDSICASPGWVDGLPTIVSHKQLARDVTNMDMDLNNNWQWTLLFDYKALENNEVLEVD